MTTRELQLDAGGEGTTVTVTNAGGATLVQQVTPGTGGTIQFRAAAAEGTSAYGVQLKNGTNAACVIRFQTDTPAVPLWFGCTSSGPVGTITAECFIANFRYSGGNIAQLRWQTNGSCNFTDQNGTVVGTILPASSDPSIKYQWRLRLNNTTGDYTLKCYNAAGTLLNTLTGNRTWSQTGTPVAMQLGMNSNHSQLLTINVDHPIFTDDTTEPAVYSSTSRVTKTLAASWDVAPPPADLVGLGVVGDSLTYQGGPGDGDGGDVEDSFVAVGWDAAHVQVSGLISREIYDTGVTPTTKTVINTWRAAGFDPKTWLLPLGTNGANDSQATQQTKMGQILDVIAQGTTGVYTVYWPTITWQDAADTRIATFRAAITAVAAARTDVHVIVIDYDAMLHNGRDESALWASSPHMTSTGYALRNSLIASQMTLLTRVVKTQAETWNTLVRATPKTQAESWDVLARPVKTLASSWDVAAATTRITKTQAESWDTRARVAKTQAESWDVRTRPVKTQAESWDVAQTPASPTSGAFMEFI